MYYLYTFIYSYLLLIIVFYLIFIHHFHTQNIISFTTLYILFFMEFNPIINYELQNQTTDPQNCYQLSNIQEVNQSSPEPIQNSKYKLFQITKTQKQDNDDINKNFTQIKSHTNPTNQVQKIPMSNFMSEQNQYFSQRYGLIKQIGYQTQKERQEVAGLFRMKPKRQSQIIKCTTETKINYMKAKVGYKSETTQLNINVKTFTKNILFDKIKMNYFDNEQKQIIKEYASSHANFETTQRLFGIQRMRGQEIRQKEKMKEESMVSKFEGSTTYIVHNDCDRIRKTCYEQYSNGSFIMDIFKSQKMAFKNKLVIVKFMQNIRESSIFPQNFKKWKNIKNQLKFN